MTLPKTFTVTLQDLQLIADVNPLRIDLVMVRNPENAGRHPVKEQGASADAAGVGGAVLVIKILDQAQPVRITEAQVVRVKKRHRGYLQ